MILDNWLIVQSFVLPGSRDKLPLLFKHLDKGDMPAAAAIIKGQIEIVEKLRNRKLHLDFQELATFLLQHRQSLTNRLDTIVTRKEGTV